MDEAELYLYLRIQHVSAALGCWRVVIQRNPKSELACEKVHCRKNDINLTREQFPTRTTLKIFSRKTHV